MDHAGAGLGRPCLLYTSPGLHIPQPDAGQLLFVQQLRNSAVPAEFHVLCLYQWLVVDLRGPQLVPAVQDVYKRQVWSLFQMGK